MSRGHDLRRRRPFSYSASNVNPHQQISLIQALVSVDSLLYEHLQLWEQHGPVWCSISRPDPPQVFQTCWNVGEAIASMMAEKELREICLVFQETLSATALKVAQTRMCSPGEPTGSNLEVLTY